MARIHIPIDRNDRWILHLIFAVLIAATCVLAYQVRADPLPKALPLAQGGAWSTDLILSAKPGATAPVTFPLGFGAERIVKPHGAIVIQDAGAILATRQYATITAPADLDGQCLLKFDDGTNLNSFDVGPMGAIEEGYPSRLGPIINDAAESTYLNFFETTSGPSVVTLTFYDGDNLFIPLAREYVEITHPVEQYRIQTEIPIGFVVITSGAAGFTSSSAPVYCFASVTTPQGGNARILPCGP